MTRNKDTNQRSRSAFAESAYAYAHAERRAASSRRRRNQDDEAYNLLYYEDDSIDQPRSNLVHAEFQPLAGASVVIIANTSKSESLTNTRTLKLMEERESLGCAIESMGGSWVAKLDGSRTTGVTHAIWIDTDEDDGKQAQLGRRALSHLSSETVVKLNTCLVMDIPVVEVDWLVKIGELSPGQHWSEINVEEFVPKVVKVFNNINGVKFGPSHHEHSHSAESSTPRSSRRDTTSSLSASISDTYHDLVKENPDVLEAEALKRAMELSMLDFALIHHTEKLGHIKKATQKDAPHEILQVAKDASAIEIKNAYRRRALETHPDKGGKPGEFEAVARAYRLLLNAANNIGLDGSFDRDDNEITLKSTAHWDSELKEHRNLVRELFAGEDIDGNLQRQQFTLDRLGLTHKDAGSQNYNEKDELIRNSCFYLSLASSYLSGIGALAVWGTEGDLDDKDKELLQEADSALISETALQLKRVIEAAVLSAHPEWAAKGMVGEEVQAFSDFLVYILESQTIVSDWAVVVYDTCSGFVDIYKGQNYKDEEEGSVDETYAASNCLTLRYVPGHYQPLVATKTRPTLKQIISVLDESSVLYVVTDGAATK